jgi:hypothetical protein
MCSSSVKSGVENLKWSVWGMSDGDDSGMDEYGTEWLVSSSEMLYRTIGSSSDLFDVARLKLNELAITLSEELTLEAKERWSGLKWPGLG